MPVNIAIDDRLLEEAQRIGKHRTKEEAVAAALGEYIQRRKQVNILALCGKIDYVKNYDYKRERRRKGR
jgi:Arc/MetJ family transcription regulator